jgi:hypothetical protein
MLEKQLRLINTREHLVDQNVDLRIILRGIYTNIVNM